jgi:RNA polymerase sigma-70 factor (ECF subfamily)
MALASRMVGSFDRSAPPDRPAGDPLSADLELMREIRAGDAEAMNEVLRKYWTGVVDYVVRFTESRDSAQDIAQDVFLSLWQQNLSWKGTGSLRSFLYGVARNRAWNQGRRWREVRVESFDSAVIPLSAHQSRDPEALLDEKLEEAEVQSIFRTALAALPPRRQEVFTLARVHGLSHQEIAETMHIAPQTVANQMSRALSDLRRALASRFDD